MTQPWRATRSLAGEDWHELRRRAIFECCKWDVQREDHCVIAPFALVLARDHWRTIAAMASRLAHEALALERELLARPDLYRHLGIPRAVRSALSAVRESSGERSVRVMRFDFHFTTEGWRISEVNSDVPGGFVEAAGLTRCFAAHFGSLVPTGDPALDYAAAIHRATGGQGGVALVYATQYSDDHQVMEYLARQLRARGLTAALAGPEHVRFEDGCARIKSRFASFIADAVIRFYPAEWLPRLGGAKQWSGFFSSRAVLSNPAAALLIQSKRTPLVWDHLRTSPETWRALLSETRSPRDVPAAERDEWVYKPALGRVGEGVAMAGVTAAAAFTRAIRRARWHPTNWIAQRRFSTIPVETGAGPVYPCLGVFTIDGQPAGCYGRASSRPLIDADAQDVVVLTDCEEIRAT
jgi:glutathionylspermidine synthase